MELVGRKLQMDKTIGRVDQAELGRGNRYASQANGSGSHRLQFHGTGTGFHV